MGFNSYIEFVKQHPRLQGETPKERISRVAELWRALKNQGMVQQGGQSNFMCQSGNPYGYIY